MTIDELRALGPGITIINAGKHAGRHEIRGAVRYRPEDLLEPAHLALPIPHDRPVVLYAEHGADETLERIAAKMRGDGFHDVRVFALSLDDYQAAGGVVQDASFEQVVPPQRAEEVNDLDRRA